MAKMKSPDCFPKALFLVLGVLVLGMTAVPVHAQEQFASRLFRPQDSATGAGEAFSTVPDKLRQIISIQLEGVLLEEALQRIAEAGGVKLFYPKLAVLSEQQVHLDLERVTVLAAVRAAIRGTKLHLQVSRSGHVVLFHAPEAKARPARPEPIGAAKTLRKLVPATLERQRAPMQTGAISGTVTDSTTGELLPGVNVVIAGTQQGSATDAQGRYVISNLEPGTYALVASFVGYATKRVEGVAVMPDDTTAVNIALANTKVGLEEVVVIGYGEQEAGNVIGSVAHISGEEIQASPVPNLSSALAGRLPGLIVTQRSGEPGHNAANLLIRGTATFGNNTPLIVIDGIQGRSLNSINPSDIESISILKDASAAIYGANSANGVIIIKTKSGRMNTEPTFTYDVDLGFKSPTVLPKMADAATYAQMIREAQLYRGVAEENMKFSSKDIRKYKSGEYPWTHPNTDWYEVAISDYTPIWNHHFYVSGGTSNISYYGSLDVLYEGGIYTNSATSFNRVNLSLQADIDVNRYLNVGINVRGIKAIRNSSIMSAHQIFTALVLMYPTQHAIYPGTNKPGMDWAHGLQPVVSPTFAPGFDKDRRYTSYNLLSATFKVPGVEGLSLEGYYAYDKHFGKRKRFQRPFTLYNFNEAAYLNSGNTGVEDGYDFIFPVPRGDVSEPHLTDYFSTSQNKTFNILLNYDNIISKNHNINAFVAYEHHVSESEGIQAFRRFFISDELPYLFAGGDPQKDNAGWVSVDGSVSYIGRINYNYDDTYFVQFGFRRDGSITFSEEHGRWGNFPSILVGWRPSQYDWWKDRIDLIDELKFKASWGKMGNDRVPTWQYLASYRFGTGVVFGRDRTYTDGLYLANVPNPFITWETANKYNVGWEMALLDYRLTFNADFFYERRSNILLRRIASVPLFTGLSLPDENFGIVDNKGFEVVLGYQEIHPEFSYGANAHFGFVRNNIVEMDEPAGVVPWQIRTGHPMGAALVFKSAGVFRDQDHVNSLPHVPGARGGDIIIKDIDGDGNITPGDRIMLHQRPIPEITYGISFNASYKNWTLSGLIQGVDRTMKRMYQERRQGLIGNYFQYDAEGRWTPQNKTASKPRAFIREQEYWRSAYITDYMYQESDYARLKELSLSYTIPERIQQSVHMKDVTVYLSGRNILLIYSESERIDPEVRSGVTYPLMRVFTIGAEFTF